MVRRTERLGGDGLLIGEAHLQQAQLARELARDEIDFRQMDVYGVDERLGQFDITLFLGVLYHLKHPILALEKAGRLLDRTASVFFNLTSAHTNDARVTREGLPGTPKRHLEMCQRDTMSSLH